MIIWGEENSEEVQSPLILVPIELERVSVKDLFTVSIPPVEDEVVLNPALKEKLKKLYQIVLPPIPEEWTDSALIEFLDLINKTFEEFGWKVEASLDLGLFSFHKLVIYDDLEKNGDQIARKQAG